MNGYGLVLAGGGAKGSYEIGVWKALKELNVPISMVAGASVGALNGAIIVQDDYDTACKLWTNLSMDTVIKMSSEVASDKEIEKSSSMFYTFIDAVKSKGLDVTPLKELLNNVIKEDIIRKSPVDLGIVTFSLTDFKPLKVYKNDIPEGKLVDYLLASSCFPAFKPQKIGNKKFIDGGVYDNIPVSLVSEKGIKDIIVVDISGPGFNRKIDNKNLNITYIKNSEDLGNTLDFDGERSKRNIEIGYLDTLKAFGKYKGKKYYLIYNDDFKAASEKYVRTLSLQDLKRMYDFIGINWEGKIPVENKIIINRLLRTIQSYCEDNKIASTSILPAMAEIAAEEMDIERIKPLSLKELIDNIIEKYNSIQSSSDFKEYISSISKLTQSQNAVEFSKELKKSVIEAKFLISYNTDINESDEKVKRFRRFISATFPKIAIANLFIAIVISHNSNI